MTSAMKGLQVTIDNVLDAILDNEWDKYVGKNRKPWNGIPGSG